MSSLEKLQNEVERQKRKITEIENSIEIVEKEFNIKFDEERKDIKEQKDFIEDPDLQIAIVGTIKAGKSTFINALFRENIASTDVTPETASLTKFIYKNENKLVVKFYNKEEWGKIWRDVEKAEKENKGKIFKEEFENSGANSIKDDYIEKSDEIIEVSDIEKLKKEVEKYTSKNSRIHYFVKELIVYLNNENMPKEVAIVDTPGLDDVVEYRSNITIDFIKNANAVIVCVDSSRLENNEYRTIEGVFVNVGEDKYKVMILGTQIDKLNNPKEDWQKQREVWKQQLKDKFKDESLLKDNIIGVSSYIFSNVIELENTGKCDKNALTNIQKLAESYGIKVSYEENDNIIINRNLIIKNSDSIKDLTNIEKVKSLMNKIVENREEEVMKDMKRKYSNMITNISNKAKTVKKANSESRKTLDMNKAEQEKFKLMKNKEIEEIETAMNGLNEAFDKIKTEWLNQNIRLKEAIKK